MEFEGLRAVIGRKWTLEILDLLATDSPQNYSAIEADIETSSDTLTRGLGVLTEYELVTRTERSKKDVQYVITARGRTVLETARDLEDILKRES